jgi:hypothetical protein
MCHLNLRPEASGYRLQSYALDICAIDERAFKTSVRQTTGDPRTIVIVTARAESVAK